MSKRITQIITVYDDGSAELNPAPSPTRKTFQGMNPTGVEDHQECPFANMIHSSRKFGSVANPFDKSCPVDALGWPTADGGAFWDRQRIIAGDYAFQCTGKAVVGTVWPGNVVTQEYRPADNQTVARISFTSPTPLTPMRVTWSGTTGGVRDISLTRPGHSTSDLFSKTFVAAIKRSATCIRFMSWAQTNWSAVSKWSDRTTLQHATWTDRVPGSSYLPLRQIPLEMRIALANECGCDMWENIPHLADDDYLDKTLAMIDATLKPGLKCWLTYSNEVWNGQFGGDEGQAQTNKKLAGIGVRQNGDPYKLNYDNSNNEDYWAWRRVAYKNVWISRKIGAAYPGGRFRVVHETQLGFGHGLPQDPYGGLLLNQLAYVKAVHGPVKDYFSAVAGAPYFSCGTVNGKWYTSIPGVTVDEYCNRLLAHAIPDAQTPFILAEDQIAKDNGVLHLAYEQGPDGQQFPNDVPAKIDAQVDPRTGAAVEQNGRELDKHFDGRCYFELQYRSDVNGYWGAAEDTSDLTVPKFAALERIAKDLSKT